MLIKLLKNDVNKCYNKRCYYLDVCNFGYLEVEKMDVKELAIGIISYCNNNNIRISNLKLQKMF